MSLRTFAAFQSDLPDDGVDDGVNWIVWPGGNVISAVRDGLVARGYGVSEPFGQEHLGWWLLVQLPGRKVDVQISDLGDRQLLVAYDKIGFWRRVLGKADVVPFRDLLLDLNAILDGAPFRDVEWYTREEWEASADPKPGAKTPAS